MSILREKYGMAPTEGYGRECPGGGRDPTDEFFKCLAKLHTAPENHQVGTCKMGSKNDPMSVVDPQLRVYGIEGLRVVDSSVMPQVPSGNTAAPAIMVGERGAELIITRHQLKSRFGSSYEEPQNQYPDVSNEDQKRHNWKAWNKRFQIGPVYPHEDWHTKNHVSGY